MFNKYGLWFIFHSKYDDKYNYKYKHIINEVGIDKFKTFVKDIREIITNEKIFSNMLQYIINELSDDIYCKRNVDNNFDYILHIISSKYKYKCDDNKIITYINDIISGKYRDIIHNKNKDIIFLNMLNCCLRLGESNKNNHEYYIQLYDRGNIDLLKAFLSIDKSYTKTRIYFIKNCAKYEVDLYLLRKQLTNKEILINLIDIYNYNDLIFEMEDVELNNSITNLNNYGKKMFNLFDFHVINDICVSRVLKSGIKLKKRYLK